MSNKRTKAKQLVVVTYDTDLRTFPKERLFRELCDADTMQISQYNADQHRSHDKKGKTFSKVKQYLNKIITKSCISLLTISSCLWE